MSFLERLKEATIGFSGYARLAREPRGALRYLVILLGVVVAINGYINLVQMRRFTAEMLQVVSKTADFRLEGGRFSYDGAMPFQASSNSGMLLIIDTTGQTGPEALTVQGGILVTADRYYLDQPETDPQEFNLALVQATLTRDDLLRFLEMGPERVVPILFGLIFVTQLAFKAVDAALLALIGLSYGRSIRRQVPFRLTYRLAIYAMSLPMIIQWIWPNFRGWTPGGSAIWWGIAIIYQLFGLRAYLISQEART